MCHLAVAEYTNRYTLACSNYQILSLHSNKFNDKEGNISVYNML